MAAAGVEFRCFVGGLAWATTDRTLGSAFSQFGEIVDLKIVNDHETGRSRGFGFVTFKDEHALRDAIEGMNGQNLDGRNITVNEAQSRRSGGSSGFRNGIGRREGGGYGHRDGGGYGVGRGYGGDGGAQYNNRGGADRKWRN